MDNSKVHYPTSTSTVTPLFAQPRLKALPKAFDGFFRHSTYNPDDVAVHGRIFDAQKAAYNTANTALSRKLKGRHLQM